MWELPGNKQFLVKDAILQVWHVDSNWKTMDSIGWHCLAISNIDILKSNHLVFLLCLLTREDCFSL